VQSPFLPLHVMNTCRRVPRIRLSAATSDIVPTASAQRQVALGDAIAAPGKPS